MPFTSTVGQIVISLRRITRSLDLHSRSLQSRYGLTAPQLAALQVISRFEPVATGDVAREVHLGYATTTGILDRLEKRELIRRFRGEDDRRSVLTALTLRGRQLLAQQPPLAQSQFQESFTALPEWEQAQILSVFLRVADMMEAPHPSLSPTMGDRNGE